jgi:hypothetical protein
VLTAREKTEAVSLLKPHGWDSELSSWIDDEDWDDSADD